LVGIAIVKNGFARMVNVTQLVKQYLTEKKFGLHRKRSYSLDILPAKVKMRAIEKQFMDCDS
jgi:hypothetical protein